MENKDPFRRALDQVRSHNLSTLPDPVPEHSFSASFEQSMQALITSERKKRRRKAIGQLVRQAAVFILTGAVSLGACMVGVNAWSQKFLVMVELKYPEYSSITFQRDAGQPAQSASLLYAPTWVPDGYRRTQHGESELFHYIDFNDEAEGRISFQQNEAENISIYLNTEGTNLEDIPFKDGQAKFLTNLGMQMVLWYDDKYCFLVTTTLPKETAIEFAESVMLKPGPYPTLQKLPIESLPRQYEPKLARENGDVVFGLGPPENLEALTRFLADCDAGKDCALRIAQYMEGGNPVIVDLQQQQGHLYATRDESRWEQSTQPFQLGEEYDNIGLLQANGQNMLMLYTSHRDKPTEVVRYES